MILSMNPRNLGLMGLSKWYLQECLPQGNIVWKFHDFSITQILREINFWDSRSAKSAISTQLEAVNFDFHDFFFAFFEGWNLPNL